jgi:hypothetical protein
MFVATTGLQEAGTIVAAPRFFPAWESIGDVAQKRMLWFRYRALDQRSLASHLPVRVAIDERAAHIIVFQENEPLQFIGRPDPQNPRKIELTEIGKRDSRALPPQRYTAALKCFRGCTMVLLPLMLVNEVCGALAASISKAPEDPRHDRQWLEALYFVYGALNLFAKETTAVLYCAALDQEQEAAFLARIPELQRTHCATLERTSERAVGDVQLETFVALLFHDESDLHVVDYGVGQGGGLLEVLHNLDEEDRSRILLVGVDQEKKPLAHYRKRAKELRWPGLHVYTPGELGKATHVQAKYILMANVLHHIALDELPGVLHTLLERSAAEAYLIVEECLTCHPEEYDNPSYVRWDREALKCLFAEALGYPVRFYETHSKGGEHLLIRARVQLSQCPRHSIQGLKSRCLGAYQRILASIQGMQPLSPDDATEMGLRLRCLEDQIARSSAQLEVP